jgi:hypothetical protein
MKKVNYNMICKKADQNLNLISTDEYELDGYRNNPITLGKYIEKGIQIAVFSKGSKLSRFVGTLIGYRKNVNQDRYVYRLKKVDKQIEWPEGKGYRQEAYI